MSLTDTFINRPVATTLATLAIALSFINPDHMNLLFRERMGQMMLGGALVTLLWSRPRTVR